MGRSVGEFVEYSGGGQYETKNLIIVCICATLLISGVVFWLTLYHYDKMTIDGNSIPIRINRLTRYTEYFVGGKWNPEKGHGRKKKLPANVQAEITGNASLSYGSFSGKIYNGSDWTVTELIFRVVAKEKDGSIRWDRKFKKSITIEPLSTSSFGISVTGNEDISSFDWYIEEALGYKVK